MRIALILLLLVCLVYVGLAATVYLAQRQFQYFPTQNAPEPEAVGLTGVAVERIETADGETVILWSAEAAEGAPTLLFLHGNGGEVANRADRLAAYQAEGFGAAFLSWRGYGGSTGQPSEGGLLADAEAAYAALRARGIAAGDIVVVGESLGTGVAVQLAARHEVGALVLGAPYAEMVALAEDVYPWLPVRLLMRDQYRSIEHIGAVTAPTLIVHGTADRVVPYASGRALYEATVAPTEFVTLEGLGHEALFNPRLWAAEIAFIRGLYGLD